MRKNRDENFKKSKSIIDDSETIDVYENLENYDLMKKRNILIVFDDMIADMEANTKLKSSCY